MSAANILAQQLNASDQKNANAAIGAGFAYGLAAIGPGKARRRSNSPALLRGGATPPGTAVAAETRGDFRGGPLRTVRPLELCSGTTRWEVAKRSGFSDRAASVRLLASFGRTLINARTGER